jgi:hypothetical protein
MLANIAELIFWFLEQKQNPKFDPCCEAIVAQLRAIVGNLQMFYAGRVHTFAEQFYTFNQHVAQSTELLNSIVVKAPHGNSLRLAVTVDPALQKDLTTCCHQLTRIADALTGPPVHLPDAGELFRQMFDRGVALGGIDPGLAQIISGFLKAAP